MEQKRKIPNITMFVIIGVSLGLFQFWPFALAFIILGGIVAITINILTGYLLNFLLVLFVEYLLMVTFMTVVFYVKIKNRQL